MWPRIPIDSPSPAGPRPPDRLARRAAPRRRPPACRLSIEALDPRIVPASLAVSDATIIEGNTGIRYASVAVSLDAPSNRTVTVNYGTANGTALAGSDYQAASGKLTFAPGQISKTILVPVIGDVLLEGDERFFVDLKGAKNAKIADGHGVVTIADDDDHRPQIVIDDVGAPEGDWGTTTYTFTVSLSAASDQAVSVADGTATTADHDYLATSGTLTFAPGETTRTLTVEVMGNQVYEPDETFFVDLNGASFDMAAVRGQGWIVDDELPDQPGEEDPGHA